MFLCLLILPSTPPGIARADVRFIGTGTMAFRVLGCGCAPRAAAGAAAASGSPAAAPLLCFANVTFDATAAGRPPRHLPCATSTRDEANGARDECALFVISLRENPAWVFDGTVRWWYRSKVRVVSARLDGFCDALPAPLLQPARPRAHLTAPAPTNPQTEALQRAIAPAGMSISVSVPSLSLLRVPVPEFPPPSPSLIAQQTQAFRALEGFFRDPRQPLPGSPLPAPASAPRLPPHAARPGTQQHPPSHPAPAAPRDPFRERVTFGFSVLFDGEGSAVHQQQSPQQQGGGSTATAPSLPTEEELSALCTAGARGPAGRAAGVVLCAVATIASWL